jgi:hypothetical protein
MALKKKGVTTIHGCQHLSFRWFYATTALRWLAITVASLSIILLLHPSILSTIRASLLGGSTGDGGLYVWLVQSFIDNPGQALRYESNSFYPYPLSRAWSDNFLLPAAIALVCVKAGLSFEAAYNAVILLAITLNGVAVTGLARSTGLPFTASFCAGLLFMNSSYMLGNIGHPQLQFFFWVPWCWSLLLQKQPALVRFFLAGVCITGAFYSAVYYAVFASLGVGIIFVYQQAIGAYRVTRTITGAVALTLGMLPILTSLPSYLAVKELFGSRGLHEAEAFAASGLSYLAFPNLAIFSNLTTNWSHPEASLCAGYLALIIAILFVSRTGFRTSPVMMSLSVSALVALATASSIIDLSTLSETLLCISAWGTLICAALLALRHASPAGLLACITVVFFVLSFGPGGNPAKSEPAYAPFTVLYYLVPGVDAVRAVSRFGIVVVMGVYIAACAACTRRISCSTRASYNLIVFLVGFTLFENYLPALVTEKRHAAPQVFQAIETFTKPDEAVVILPFAQQAEHDQKPTWSGVADLHTRYMQWSSGIQRSFVNGYSGQRSKLQTDLSPALAEFPSSRARDALSRICGVRWIILIPHLIEGFNLKTFNDQMAQHVDKFEITQSFSDGSMLIRLISGSTVTPLSHPIFMSPAGRNLLLSISAPTKLQGDVPCSTSVTKIERAGSGELHRLLIKDTELSSSTQLSLPAELFHDTRRPAVFDVQTRNCNAVVACDVR